jgi:hypothetical protein
MLGERCIRALMAGCLEQGPYTRGFWDWDIDESAWLSYRRAGLAREAALALVRAGSAGSVHDLDPKIEGLLEYDMPMSQSPGVRVISLRQIIDQARYIVLIPMAAGCVNTMGSLVKGEWTAAFWSAAAGGASAVVLVGSMWIADKLFSGMKYLNSVPQGGAGTRSQTLPPASGSLPPSLTSPSPALLSDSQVSGAIGREHDEIDVAPKRKRNRAARKAP